LNKYFGSKIGCTIFNNGAENILQTFVVRSGWRGSASGQAIENNSVMTTANGWYRLCEWLSQRKRQSFKKSEDFN
jgi:hypothetical protein